MTSDDERQPWEFGGDAEGSDAPAYPTNEPLEEGERGELAAPKEADESSEAGEETGPLDDGEPPPERTHEDEGAVGAGSQYAAEDADDEHSEPQGPAGAA